MHWRHINPRLAYMEIHTIFYASHVAKSCRTYPGQNPGTDIIEGIGVDANSTSQRWLTVLSEKVQGSAECLHDQICVTEI
jgi:hypothetical protein